MTEPRVFNTAPRPRMVIRGFHDNPDLVARLAALVPTHTHVHGLGEVSQDEWDVLVTDDRLDEDLSGGWSAGHRPVQPSLFVIYVSKEPGFGTVDGDRRWRGSISQNMGHIRRELRRSTDVPARVQPLVEQFEPILRARPEHEYFTSDSPVAPPNVLGASVISQPPKPKAPQLQPFAETADGRVLAGRYPRSDSSEAWLLPSDVPDVVAWVTAALSEWHQQDPERFPGSPDWTRQPDWATPAERRVMGDLAAVRAERAATVERLDLRERELVDELACARQASDVYERALLTAQSEELVQAVLRALTEIGFTVRDGDTNLAGAKKLEDLQITDPDQPDWIALAEVKGYGKGAQTGALTQFIRFERQYRDQTGQSPDAVWYIANQFMNHDPASRQLILQGNEADIEGFAEVGGLVIDTVELFRLLDAVRTGEMSPPEARQHLRGSSGRFSSTPNA